ncbi:CIA30 family protein [Shewanella sp. SG41-4]|uniref:CIA30 family protein n=1 Tax=Shewanella sp. SG41-4 TaxID=2760976 RepID=UPI001600689D|nr:CIA30 family protein [Shewanella sp. SG41-4]MBB1439511.1 CIA30 family protein [Shewanella sp. SG41-4]
MMVLLNTQDWHVSQKVQIGIGTAVGILLLIGQPVWGASEDNMLFHFTEPSHFAEWDINNDTVMGGISQSQIKLNKQQALLFSGQVSLENNGGFASTESTFTHQITDASSLTLTAKGDGKTYQIRLKTPSLSYGEAYVANFRTDADTLTQHSFTPADFTVSFRGRAVTNAPTLNFEDIDRIGFLVAQKQQGPFTIELHSIQFDQ